MNPLVLRIIGIVVLVVLSFLAGFKVKAGLVAERDLAIKEAKDALIEAYRTSEEGKAKVLEDKLASLKANERVIEREKLKIVNRDVYRNECLDNDGVRLIEDARSGKSSTTKPVSSVSGVK